MTQSTHGPPTDIDSTDAKLVYVYLTSVTEATVRSIAETLNLKLIELLPTLRSLQQAGHVERSGDTCRIVN